MHVFISWSGGLSRQLAQVLRNWLPSTLQYVKPYFTPSDIEKGTKWDSEISQRLAEANVCIIALTPESLSSKWIMFEAGAISRSVDKARVCAILFGLEPTDVEGPLDRFQATKFTKEDIRQLLITINANAGTNALDAGVLNAVFEKWWPDLNRDVTALLDADKRSPSTTPKIREDKDLIEETLLLTRTIANQQQELFSRVENIHRVVYGEMRAIPEPDDSPPAQRQVPSGMWLEFARRDSPAT